MFDAAEAGRRAHGAQGATLTADEQQCVARLPPPAEFVARLELETPAVGGREGAR